MQPQNLISEDKFIFKEITLDDLKSEADEILNTSYNNNLFSIRTANIWMSEASKRPTPKMLFGEFWFEGEICILFADTNLGKSILAVQICDSLSNGVGILGFKFEASKQKVLYFDFELNDKQFESRYTDNYLNHYKFSDLFIRAEINTDCIIPESQDFEDFLNASIENAIINTSSKILIIDNMTYLRNGTERAQHALPLMKHLKMIKNKYNLSILVLAHTPKRDLTKPITRNDLQGSKMLINFCDSAFTIGESQSDKSIRYLKQIKARNVEIIYDSENVLTLVLAKPSNFLEFQFVNLSAEKTHLKQVTEADRNAIIQKVKELNQQGKSQRQIAIEQGISLGAVNKYINI